MIDWFGKISKLVSVGAICLCYSLFVGSEHDFKP